ncbi:hypothetical protein BaRGS_00030669, partial [Batillaria attramentaria]
CCGGGIKASGVLTLPHRTSDDNSSCSRFRNLYFTLAFRLEMPPLKNDVHFQ